MRILLIMDPGISVPPLLYGGIEREVYQLAEGYQKLGHQVTLLAGPDSHCSGNTVTFGTNDLSRSKSQKYREVWFVWRYLISNKNNFDVIHNFGRLIYFLPVLNNRVKKYMSYQRQVHQPGIKFITRLPHKNLFFTACSNYCVGTGNVAGNWTAVYNGIDFSLYQLNKTVSTNAPLIFLGRLDKIKGVTTAITVAKATGNKLVIAGNISHTADNYQYFKTEVEPQIDNDQITYVGAVNDAEKNTLLRSAKALLFPIEWDEPFGIVMVESMACGTPVVAFKRGAVPEVVTDGITGFVVDNPEQMIQKVSEINAIDREKCRATASERFDDVGITNQYLDLFKRTL